MVRNSQEDAAAIMHTKFVRLMIGATVVIMALTFTFEWVGLPDRVVTQGLNSVPQQDEFFRRVRGDQENERDGLALDREPRSLGEKVLSLEKSVARAKHTLKNLESAFDKLESIPVVRERVNHLNRKMLKMESGLD
eukprot:m.263713 g.263713  ORF g.263713 m.263713 type:complete len:136 (-) comp26714_c0_seq1:4289-4696(-)